MHVPRLVAERRRPNGLVDAPTLAAGKLKHEDVMDIVVRGEARILRRGDVGVDLYGMPELRRERNRELLYRRPQPVQTLQNERRASSELG